MIFTSALCYVIALSYTSANTESKQAKVEELMDEISSSLVGELVQVANTANATNTSEAELDAKLQDTTRVALERLEPELIQLIALSGNSTDEVADSLAHKIDGNKALRNALSNEEKIAPRSIGLMLVKAAKVGFTMLDQYLQTQDQPDISDSSDSETD